MDEKRQNLTDQQVACTFIGSAYLSQQCGNDLGPKREEHIETFRAFLRGEISFPNVEVNHIGPITNALANNTLKEYVYVGHFAKVMEDIKENNQEEQLKERTPARYSFFNCIPRICRVNRIDASGKVYVKDPYSKLEEQAKLFEGIRVPDIGDKVLLHWKHVIDLPDESDSFYRDLISRNEIERRKYGI